MRKTIAGGFDENALFFDAGYDDCCFSGSCTNECIAISRWYCASHEISDLEVGETCPGRGDHSPGITILHVDPQTGATLLMIRSPKNYHAPKHWHTANETHTVVSGTFIMKDEGGEPCRRAPIGL